VYFAVKVTDDKLHFGINRFENPFWEDGVEFQLFGDKQSVYAGQISISVEKDGMLKLEGRDPISNEKFPYFWTAAGVKAALRQGAAGYDVELAIPWSILRWTGWEKGHITGMNLLVYDRDDEKNLFSGFGLVEWAANPGQEYGALQFDSIPAPEGQYKPETFDTMLAILRNIKNAEWDAAEAALAGAGDGRWVKPMLAFVQKKTNQPDKYRKSYIEAAKAAPNPSVAWWAVEALYLDLRTNERRAASKEDIACYEAISALPMSDSMRFNIALSMGKSCFLNGEFAQSKKVIEKLVNSPDSAAISPSIMSDARELLEAINLALAEGK
jgi:hypothetical protein